MLYHINDFISDEKNSTPAFVEAISKLDVGDTLCLDGKKYDFRLEGALIKHYCISNNDEGDKPIALPIIGKENITIDGGGACLIFHGEMLPVVVDNSKNIILRDFSIDYEVPMYGQAEIVEVAEDKTVLKFDGKQFLCRVDENGDFCFCSNNPDWSWERHRRKVLAMEFDREGKPASGSWAYFPCTVISENRGFLRGMYRDITLEALGDGLIAMHGNTGVRHTVGNYLIMTYNAREFPGIFTTDSDNLLYSDITLHHTMSMGFITQNSKNIVLRRVNTEPRRDIGRLLSVTADATHFVNCRGKIELDNCRLEYMMDDACNIHGIYHIYESRESDNSIILRCGHPQHKGINTYRAGDTVYIIDEATMKTVAEAKVVSAELLQSNRLRLIADRTIPDAYGTWLVENISAAPDIYIHDCVSGYNRPRGFLLSSRGSALVERCSFHNMYCGIQFSAEVKNWYESGPTQRITIRNNDFTNSAYCGGCCINGDVNLNAAKNDPNFTFFGKVIVEGNHFEQGGKRMMSVQYADEVIFKNNTYRINSDYCVKTSINQKGIHVEFCSHKQIEDANEL